MKENETTQNPSRFTIRLSLEGFITYITKNSKLMIGYDPEELIGIHISEIMHQDDFQRAETECQTKKEEVSTDSYRMKKKDGTDLWVEVTKTVINHSNGHLPAGIICLVNDISKKVEVEENIEEIIMEEAENNILELEKLKVVGQLAAGVAHEIKNPLTSIKGFIQLMKAEEYPSKKYLEIMEDEIQRLEIISSELLVLAKPHKHTMKVHDITKLVREVVFLLEAEAVKKSIEIKCKVERDDLSIVCDIHKVKQVLINLIKNAIEAMEKPGTITVQISECFNTAKVSVTDEGCGIPEEFIEQLGKPFFSTKSNGNGLGLMICQKIISEHGGKMAVHTLKGKGTTFTIKIPLFKK